MADSVKAIPVTPIEGVAEGVRAFMVIIRDDDWKSAPAKPEPVSFDEVIESLDFGGNPEPVMREPYRYTMPRAFAAAFSRAAPSPAVRTADCARFTVLAEALEEVAEAIRDDDQDAAEAILREVTAECWRASEM